MKLIQNLDSNKSSGTDIIPIRTIKEFAEQLAPPLAIIYNKIIETGIFPDKWKTANVTPIHKTGDQKNIKIIVPYLYNQFFLKSWRKSYTNSYGKK